MGDRSRIIVTSKDFIEPIHLYGHWSGTDNVLAVVDVLSRTDRIGDPAYLTAQLFYEFSTRANYDGNLSFGISVGENRFFADDNEAIIISADDGNVVYREVVYTKQEFLDTVFDR
jgi:hypothetical protein